MGNLLDFYIKGKAAMNPDRVLIRSDAGDFTFRDLDKKCSQLAQIFFTNKTSLKNPSNTGIIVTFLPKSFETISCNIASLMSGKIFTNLDIKSPKERLSKLIQNLEPDIICTKSEFEHLLPSPLPVGTSVIFVDELVFQEESNSRENFNDSSLQSIDSAPACIVNTSGSTGVPKSVVLSHVGLFDFVEWCTKEFDFSESDKVGSLSPFFFDIYLFELFLCLKEGCQMILLSESLALFPNELVERIVRDEITFLFWVPTVMVNIANLDSFSTIKPSKLKRIFYAGEPFPVKQLNYWRENLSETQIVNLYGPIEISVDCTFHVIDRTYEENESAPIGKACSNTEILILDENMNLIESGDTGELYVKGLGVALGYYKSEGETAKAFIQNPLHNNFRDIVYRTGDLVRKDANGDLIFVGRKDTQIKHMGYRIELGEIEKTAMSISEVRNACVVYDKEKKLIRLFTELFSEKSPEDLRKELFTMLPKYMVPSEIQILDKLPMNANGKIDRNTLAQTP
jgi:amino acid adenylation domain-containing protein